MTVSTKDTPLEAAAHLLLRAAAAAVYWTDFSRLAHSESSSTAALLLAPAGRLLHALRAGLAAAAAAAGRLALSACAQAWGGLAGGEAPGDQGAGSPGGPEGLTWDGVCRRVCAAAGSVRGWAHEALVGEAAAAGGGYLDWEGFFLKGVQPCALLVYACLSLSIYLCR
jgi:hypothetical protein